MRIVFTKHALEQIKIRKIDKIEVISTVNNPDKIIYDKFGYKDNEIVGLTILDASTR